MDILQSLTLANDSNEAKKVMDKTTPLNHAVTIGNFDGCHLGHQKLIKKTIDYTRESNSKTKSLALTFNPRPNVFFNQKNAHEKALFSAKQKSRAFLELGLDVICEQNFNFEFSQLSPIEFYEIFLKNYLKTEAIVVGDNFFFAKNRLGTTELLSNFFAKDKLYCHIGSPVNYKSQIISSTRIRDELCHGQLCEANSMLGRPYLIEGFIKKGKQLGRKIGFPTINLEGSGQLYPKKGVYAGFAWIEDHHMESSPSIFPNLNLYQPAVINIGHRPTFHKQTKELKAEAHLLDYKINELDQNYNKKTGFYFTHYLRKEIKFDHATQLTEQIKKDIAQAKVLLSQI